MEKQKIDDSHCEIKWNNGYWKLFDSENYKDIQIFNTFEELAQYLFDNK